MNLYKDFLMYSSDDLINLAKKSGTSEEKHFYELLVNLCFSNDVQNSITDRKIETLGHITKNVI